MATGLAIGALVAGTAATVASGVLSSKAQKSANDTNVDMMHEQMAYQTGEREAVQEYNTPANQRHRFEEAGINPYMALGNMDSGNAQMQTGVQPAQVNPVTGLADMINQLGMAPQNALSIAQGAEQIQALKEANTQARIESLYKERDKLADLRIKHAQASQILSQTSKNHAEYDQIQRNIRALENQIRLGELDVKYHENYLKARNARERNSADLLYRQERNAYYEEQINKVRASYADVVNEAQLRQIQAACAAEWASAASSHSLARLYSEQAATEFGLRALRKYGLQLDNKQKDIVLSNIGEQINLGLEWQRTQIRQGQQDIENPFRYFGAGLGAMLGAGVAGAGARTVVSGFK